MCNIYTIIYSLCKSKGVSIARMCSDLSISRSTISELKAQRSKGLSYKTASAIASYFDVPVEFLSGNGVFANWDEIIKNIDQVFIRLREDLPLSFYWHEEDEKNLYALLDTQFYYGNEYPVFTKFLIENVIRISFRPREDPDEIVADIEYRESFAKRLNVARQEEAENPGIKAVTMQEAMLDFFERHRPEDNDDVAELVRISNKLSAISRRQLLRYAYQLLFSQKSDDPPEQTAAPPDIDMAAALVDGRVKK